MTTGIYAICHKATGRLYVGQAVDMERRWNRHRQRLRARDHHSPHLQAAWHHYGEEAFEFRALLVCRPEDLTFYEQRVFNAFQLEFNTAKIAQTRRGVPHSPESRAKIGAAHRGRKRSPEVCAKLSAAQMGKVHSPEAKAKMRTAKLGKVHTPEARANMAEGQRNRPRPASEYDSRRGRPRDPDVIARSAATRTGTKRTEEQRARMRAAAQAMAPEKREQIAEARRQARQRRLEAT